MHTKKLIIGLLFILLAFAQSMGQTLRLSDKPEDFADELANFMKNAKLQSVDKIADEFAANFKGGPYSVTQKEQIIRIAKAMADQQMGPVPYYSNFCALLNTAVSNNLDATHTDQLLKTIHKALYNVNAPTYVNLMLAYGQFINSRQLFANSFLRLKVSNEQYAFEYRGGKRIPGDTVGLYAEQNPVYVDRPEPPEPPKDKYGNFIPDQERQPEVKGAIIEFGKTDLTWSTTYDSSTLYQTKGAVMLENNVFVGEGGKFDWSVTGLEPAEIVAELKKYSFKTTLAELKCSHVDLKYPKVTDKVVPGTFEFKSVAHRSPEASLYPKFRSYFSDYVIKNVPEDITCKGGVSLDGRYTNTANIFETPSEITLKYQGKVVYKGTGKRFEFQDSLVNSPEASSVIYWKGDSLAQPGSKLIYATNKKVLRLITAKSRFEGAPYLDTYHKIEVTCDEIRLRLDSAKIEYLITSANNRVPAVFESIDRYDENRIGTIQGIYDFNALLMLMKIYVKNKSDEIYVSELPDEAKRKMNTLTGALNTLAGYGYIKFDERAGKIYLTDKIKHYYLSLKNKKDYDNVLIPSISPNKPNAIQDLEKRELLMNGVKKFTISDSLDVYVIPKNEEMKLLKDRDIQFDGKINAGVFLTHGKKFKFDYTNFKVVLEEIDSIGIKLPPVRDSLSGKMKAAAPVKLENKRHGDSTKSDKPVKTHGTLFINKPNNKSGKKKMPQYPIFDVVDFSFVYFDAPHILKGAYNQDVYFQVPPFNIDSTASTNLSAISFEGDFHSDNIFPDFHEFLRVQPDRSLGFVHKVPEKGYSLYKGNATFFGTVSLSNRGIRGKGEIKYLTSTIKSDDFIFYQDSVIAKGNTFILKEENSKIGNFPDAVTSEFSMKWLPKRDSLIVRNNPAVGPFRMYKGTSTLDGELVLSSGGVVKGAGAAKREGSQVKSRDMTFQIDNFTGRNADFEIESSTEGKPAMRSTNVKFKYDMVKKMADFETEEAGFASHEFPYTQFKTSIGKAIWDFDNANITMSKPAEVDIANSIFYSTLPELDSVNFQAAGAVYDLKTYALKISGVPYIRIADSELLPDSGQVEVLENAQITPLRNSVIFVDTINKYHKLIKGDVVIKNRHQFEGSALYQYVNADNDTLDITFSEFKQERREPKNKKKLKDVLTKGFGNVPEDNLLRIAPGVLFRGDVRMIATKKNLEFEGAIALDLKGNSDRTWVKFKKTTDDNNFAVDLKGATNASGQAVTTGLFYGEGNSLYSLFVDSKRNPSDRELFSSSGTLKTDVDSREFRVGKVEKLAPGTKVYEGNVFAFSDTTQTDFYDGKFSFLPAQEKNFLITAAGNGKGNRKTGVFSARLTMILEFAMTDPAFKTLAADLFDKKKNAGLGEVGLPLDSVSFRIGDIAGQKAAETFRNGYGSYKSLIEAGSKFGKGIVLSDVQLIWNAGQGAWHSVGTIGVGNVNKQDINARVEGYLEIRRTERGDVIKLLLQPTPDNWYYISYDENKKLYTIATNNTYNAEIATKGKASKTGAGTYAFGLADDADRVDYVKSFNKNYLGKDVEPTPFVPEIGTKPAQPEPSPAAADSTAPPSTAEPVQQDGDQPAQVVSQPTQALDPITGQPLPDQPAAQQADQSSSTEQKKEDKKEEKKDRKKDKDKGKKNESAPEPAKPAEPEIDPITGQPITPAEVKPADSTSNKATDSKPAEAKPAEPAIDPITGQPIAPSDIKPVDSAATKTSVVDSTVIKAKLDSVRKVKSDSIKKVETEALKLKEEAQKQEELKRKEEEAKKAEADRKAKEEKEAKEKAEKEAKEKAEKEAKEKEKAPDTPPLLPPPTEGQPADSTQKPPGTGDN